MKLEVNAMSIRISGKIQKLLSFFVEKLKPNWWPQVWLPPSTGWFFQYQCVCVSAGKKSFCPPPPLWVQDGQGVSDIGRNTYANLMTPTGNKNCQSLWLFRVEPALVSSNTCAACCCWLPSLAIKYIVSNFFWQIF